MCLLVHMCPTVPQPEHLYFCGCLFHCNYFWNGLCRACLGSWKVDWSGWIGFLHSERLTLSNVPTGRYTQSGGREGRREGPHGPSGCIQICGFEDPTLTFAATMMHVPKWPHHQIGCWPSPVLLPESTAQEYKKNPYTEGKQTLYLLISMTMINEYSSSINGLLEDNKWERIWGWLVVKHPSND